MFRRALLAGKMEETRSEGILLRGEDAWFRQKLLGGESG